MVRKVMRIMVKKKMRNITKAKMGQIVEKPRGDLEKVLPREDLKPRVCLQILPRGNFFQVSPKAFPQSVRLWFSRGARSSPTGPLRKNLGNPK